MSSGNIAYLILVGAGFAAFMLALSYGHLSSSLADRRAARKPAAEKADPIRKAA